MLVIVQDVTLNRKLRSLELLQSLNKYKTTVF